MKLDKETVIKEHFWFLLGLVLLMVFLSLILLWTTTGGAIAKEKKLYDEQKSKLDRIVQSQPKNGKWLEKQGARLKQEEGKEGEVWGDASKSQFFDDRTRFMTWPDTLPLENREKLYSLYFGDPIDDTTLNRYAKEYYNESRQAESQVVEAVQQVQPEIVQFREPWYNMIRWVQFGKWTTLPPTPEDVWLAQEDIWVQSGLLKIIRDTNDLLAEMKMEKSQGDRHKVFTNVNWSLDLELTSAGDKAAFQYKLTNIGRRRQILPITFEVTFGGRDKPAELEVTAPEPLTPGKSVASPKDGKPISVEFGNPPSIVAVKQIFDWRTVPIKRIEQIQLGWNSVRTSGVALVPPQGGVFQKDEKTDTTPYSQPSSAKQPSSAAPDVGRVTGAASAGSADKTNNGLERNRYVEVSPQVRRMPVGLGLVVDQAHIQDVLTMVANSPLRIQTTQWHWRRFHGDIRPKEEEDSAPARGPERVDGARPVQPPEGKRVRFNGLVPGVRQGTSATITSTTEEQPDWDLVELAVYGIASLYERYPPKAAQGAPATTGTTTAPTTSAAQPTKSSSGVLPGMRLPGTKGPPKKK